MSYTKYVMDGQGKFVMISKYAGLEHRELALLLEDEPVSAGFVTTDGVKLITYSQSITLALKSRETDSDVMNAALEDRTLQGAWDNVTDHWYAGNITHIPMREGPQDIEWLRTKKILDVF